MLHETGVEKLAECDLCKKKKLTKPFLCWVFFDEHQREMRICNECLIRILREKCAICVIEKARYLEGIELQGVLSETRISKLGEIKSLDLTISPKKMPSFSVLDHKGKLVYCDGYKYLSKKVNKGLVDREII